MSEVSGIPGYVPSKQYDPQHAPEITFIIGAMLLLVGALVAGILVAVDSGATIFCAFAVAVGFVLLVSAIDRMRYLYRICVLGVVFYGIGYGIVALANSLF